MKAETDDLVKLCISASAAAREIDLFLRLIMPDPRRFATVDEQDISNLLKEKDSGSTKKVIQGSVRLFRAYLVLARISKMPVQNSINLKISACPRRWFVREIFGYLPPKVKI